MEIWHTTELLHIRLVLSVLTLIPLFTRILSIKHLCKVLIRSVLQTKDSSLYLFHPWVHHVLVLAAERFKRSLLALLLALVGPLNLTISSLVMPLWASCHCLMHMLLQVCIWLKHVAWGILCQHEVGLTVSISAIHAIEIRWFTAQDNFNPSCLNRGWMFMLHLVFKLVDSLIYLG